jgi:hypothetical protein
MQGKSLTMVRIQAIQVVESQTIATVTCHDYDEYRVLPDAIEVQGQVLGKTGWSSDKCYACYKSGVLLGTIVDLKA